MELIDIGESSPRQICSGLRQYIDLSTFSSSRVCVICNLKPSVLRGITSYGMILAASNNDHSIVELIQPPNQAPIGTRISLSNIDVAKYTPDAIIDIKKKNNVWERIYPLLKTDNECRATYNTEGIFQTSHGVCRCKTLANSQIS